MPLNRKNRVSIKKKKMNSAYPSPRSFKFTQKNLEVQDVFIQPILMNNLKSKVKFSQLPDLIASTIPMDTTIILGSEIKNNTQDGCTCRRCGNYNEYAEPNQEDGSFICFSCKNDY